MMLVLLAALYWAIIHQRGLSLCLKSSAAVLIAAVVPPRSLSAVPAQDQ
jgi:hypothetical protein